MEKYLTDSVNAYTKNGVFFVSRYYSLLRLVQVLWIIAGQDEQETWCCFVFTFSLQRSQEIFVAIDVFSGIWLIFAG